MSEELIEFITEIPTKLSVGDSGEGAEGKEEEKSFAHCGFEKAFIKLINYKSREIYGLRIMNE